jgi:hypothetical protein
MPTNAAIRLGITIQAALQRGPLSPKELIALCGGVSQPTLSRALATLGSSLVSFGKGRSIQYSIQDEARSELLTPVYRVDPSGQLSELGTLIPVRTEGFVMVEPEGRRLHTEGLPWWLFDMRPQGFLGRAYQRQYGPALGLPSRVDDWNDSHVLRALQRQGADLPGNLIVGQPSRDTFINQPPPPVIPRRGKGSAYVRLADAAARGEHSGSSAAGEQPKFTGYVETSEGPAHVIVKFSAATDTEVSARWRDLLVAEDLALQTLSEHGIPAARSDLIRHQGQHFLEVQRFDRVGALGRRALFSLTALDAEFVGSAKAWPSVTRALAKAGIVTPASVPVVEVLWAFGVLIANTDMHGGNLSFLSDQGRPYAAAPAYDMTCMAFAPGPGGDLSMRSLPLRLSEEVPAKAWMAALPIAQDFLQRLRRSRLLTKGFDPCLAALTQHLEEAAQRIRRLAPPSAETGRPYG